uniref:t-SNARE coiled-coil homology domain-containing protein n=1 Tax=Gasterosteus aculeatus aculeatus TaxID=481459 RepID=A0AAQ4R8V5_GASAC
MPRANKLAAYIISVRGDAECEKWSVVGFFSRTAQSDLSHDSVDDLLDQENKRLAENLATKVSRLKSLAYDIDREADDQNEYLDGMDSNFLSATGLLSGSVKRFSTMVRSGRDNRRILCYVSVGLVLVFFLLYYMVSRIQS